MTRQTSTVQRTREWSDLDKATAADLVTSYADGLSRALRFFNVEQDELDDVLLDMNVERCECGWYDDSHGFIPSDESEPDGFCRSCR